MCTGKGLANAAGAVFMPHARSELNVQDTRCMCVCLCEAQNGDKGRSLDQTSEVMVEDMDYNMTGRNVDDTACRTQRRVADNLARGGPWFP